MRYHNFDDYVVALAAEDPHALVQGWWARLEREIRGSSKRLGSQYKVSVAKQIDLLAAHPSVSHDIVVELHAMRRKRNAVAHDLCAPAIGADEAETFARRAWGLGWFLAGLC